VGGGYLNEHRGLRAWAMSVYQDAIE
jgi:hypothetical protein